MTPMEGAEIGPLPLITGAPDIGAMADLRLGAVSWRSWVGPLISLGVLCAAIVQLRSLDFARTAALVPVAIPFWLALAAAYLALPASEWLIYRKLWQLPASGFLPLLRKSISNEVLLGYSGELYFYSWARRHVTMSAAPFGVIKDVAILSAQVGNLVTLILAAFAWPLMGSLHLGVPMRGLILSSGLVIAMSMPALLFRRRVLTLRARALWRIAFVHMARVVGVLLFSAAMWHVALPTVAWTWWLLLAALRQLLSRLPLMPNKDLAFAGLVAYLIGARTDIVSMMTMTASLILALHLVLGTMLALADLATPSRDL